MAVLAVNRAEAELFGYRRSAFTGAERASPGYFSRSHGGTFFPGEMPELWYPIEAMTEVDRRGAKASCRSKAASNCRGMRSLRSANSG